MPCVHLEEITPDKWRTKLRVREEQKHYVSDVSGILARAYACRKSRSRVRLIYADDEPVGMLLYYDLESYDLSQFLLTAGSRGEVTANWLRAWRWRRCAETAGVRALTCATSKAMKLRGGCMKNQVSVQPARWMGTR